jgi:hypothetical protein
MTMTKLGVDLYLVGAERQPKHDEPSSHPLFDRSGICALMSPTRGTVEPLRGGDSHQGAQPGDDRRAVDVRTHDSLARGRVGATMYLSAAATVPGSGALRSAYPHGNEDEGEA